MSQTITEAVPQSAPIAPPIPGEPSAPLKLVPKTISESPSKAFAIEGDPRGHLNLEAKFRSSQPVVFAVRQRTRDLEERLQGRLVTAIEADPAFHRIADLRPQFRATQAALSQAQARKKSLQERLSGLERAVPPPANLGARLVALRAELDQAKEAVAQASAEHGAISEVYATAVAALEHVVPALAKQVHATFLEGMRRDADELVGQFMEECGGRLLEIALGCRLLQCVPPLKPADTDALTRRILESPDPIEEPASAE